ncbi:MAG: winged helix-turn-helix domain-containing protein [Treponema sp.]|nr:winged helix-turn-helix domain-containing protein [Treponema sp.]
MASTTDLKKISNPLTIIGMFAVLAEIAGTVVLPILNNINIQKIFIWYVMLFPILLVILFFLTLWIVPKNLYSPTDYSDEENFMRIMTKKDSIDDSLEKINKEVSEMMNVIKNSSDTKSEVNTSTEEFYKNLNDRLDAINKKLLQTKEINDSIEIHIPDSVPKSAILRSKVYNYIKVNPNCSMKEISEQLGLVLSTTIAILKKLEHDGVVIETEKNKWKIQ